MILCVCMSLWEYKFSTPFRFVFLFSFFAGTARRLDTARGNRSMAVVCQSSLDDAKKEKKASGLLKALPAKGALFLPSLLEEARDLLS